MMKKILLVLDSGDSAAQARDCALQLARRHQAGLTALALIDATPLLEGEAMPPGAYAYRAARDASFARRWQENAEQLQAAVRERAAGLDLVLLTEQAGDGHPEDALQALAPQHDLLVVSADSHLGDVARVHDARWLADYLQDPARPLLLFSPDVHQVQQPGCVLLAYDGSPCAARALQQFVFLGLWHDLPRKVICHHADPAHAARLAEEGAAYLARHGLPATVLAPQARGEAAALLMQACRQHDAALLVMGAFGRNSWKERLFGSTTRTLMQHSPVPLLMFH